MTEIYGVTYVNYSAQFVANEAGVTSNIARILCVAWCTEYQPIDYL